MRPLFVVPLVAAACGRIGFGPGGDGGTTRDAPSDSALDAIPGLVVVYPMETAAGGVVPATVAAYTGTCVDCPTVVPGMRGNAYHFAGAASTNLPPITANLVTMQPYTVAVWLRTQGDMDNDLIAVSKAYSSAGNSNVFSLGVPAGTGELAYETTPDGTAFDYITTPIGAATWHHVTARWDGAKRVLFRDGVEGASSTAPLVDSTEGNRLEIGADLDFDAPFHNFIGDIDDLRFYDRALADAEIATLAAP